MYALSFNLYDSFAWTCTAIYARLVETYRLPDIHTLLTSIDEDADWGNCDDSTQAYYIDNLRGPNKGHTFQVRFRTSRQSQAFTNLFLSLNDHNQVHSMSLQFQPRGDRFCSSRIIGWLKEIAKTSCDDAADFHIEGYSEQKNLRFLNEHNLNAFQWNGRLGRYLHAIDDYSAVKEVRNGLVK